MVINDELCGAANMGFDTKAMDEAQRAARMRAKNDFMLILFVLFQNLCAGLTKFCWADTTRRRVVSWQRSFKNWCRRRRVRHSLVGWVQKPGSYVWLSLWLWAQKQKLQTRLPPETPMPSCCSLSYLLVVSLALAFERVANPWIHHGWHCSVLREQEEKEKGIQVQCQQDRCVHGNSDRPCVSISFLRSLTS